jgi:hypothetical protein
MLRSFLVIGAGASVALAACADPGATQSPTVSMFHAVVPSVPATIPQPPAPSGNAVWVPASYEWNGSTYALQSGHWAENVPGGEVWQAGHWALGPSNSYVWVKGAWVGL